MSLRFLFSPNICPLYIGQGKKQDAKIPRKPKFLPVRIFRSLKNPEIGSSTLAKPLKNLFPRNLYTRVEFLREKIICVKIVPWRKTKMTIRMERKKMGAG